MRLSSGGEQIVWRSWSGSVASLEPHTTHCDTAARPRTQKKPTTEIVHTFFTYICTSLSLSAQYYKCS